MPLRERSIFDAPWGMLRHAILLLLFCSVIFAEPKSLSQHWRETGLTWKTVAAQMTPEICQASPLHFLACVEAARSVLTRVGSRLDIVSHSDLGRGAQATFAVGGFTLAPARPAVVLPLAELRGEQRRVREFWAETFEARRDAFDFAVLWSWLEKRIPPEIEAETSGGAYNVFLGVARDPQTRIVPKSFNQEQDAKKEDQFFGVGLTLARLADQIFIRKVTPQSPAARAGLRVLDVLVQVDGTLVNGLSVEAVGQKLSGHGARPVRLLLQRGGQRFSVRVTPEQMVKPRVESATLSDGKHKWGYLKLHDFSGYSNCLETEKAIQAFEAAKVNGLILDLRGNPGGRMQEALCIANLFFPEGQRIFSMLPLPGFSGPEYYGTSSVPPTTVLPLVVLVNSESASASELLAGAFQDHARALVVGNRTFGKGTVQYELAWEPNDKLSFFETRAAFYLPSGRTNQILTIHPDLEFADPFEVLRTEDLYWNPVQVTGTRPVPKRDFSALKECIALQPANRTPVRRADESLTVARAALACWQSQPSLRWEFIGGADL